MFTKNTLCKTLIAGSLALGATTSYAYPTHAPDIDSTQVYPPYTNVSKKLDQYGEIWTLKNFIDESPAHPNTNENIRICFTRIPDSGTHSKYKWHTIGGPWWMRWTGMASKEGDQVFMNGVRRYAWQCSSNSDYMQWDLASKDLGTGHWRFWINNRPQSFHHRNIIMTRTNQKCKPQKHQEFPVDKARVPELPAGIKADDPQSLLLYFGSDSKPKQDSAVATDAVFNQGVIKIISINIPNAKGNVRTYDIEMSLVPDDNEILFRLDKATPTE